jgi:tetratricopeptide (TPR) repeat protein
MRPAGGPAGLAILALPDVLQTYITLFNDEARMSFNRMLLSRMRLFVYLIIVTVLFVQCRSHKVVTGVNDFGELSGVEKFEYEYSLNEGIKHKLLGDLPRALYFFKRCIEIFPLSDVSYYELANIYFMAGEINFALDFSRMALKLDPGNLYYYQQTALIMREAGMHRDAIAVYRTAVDRFPEEIELKFTLAGFLARDKQFKEALDVYNSLEKSVGIDERISLPRERIYMEMGEFEKASLEITRLIEKFPGEARYYGILAELYISLAMFDEAQECYDKLFQMDPENGMGQISISEFYMNTGRVNEALIYLKSAFRNPGLDLDEKVRFLKAVMHANVFSGNSVEDLVLLGEILHEEYPGQGMVKAVLSDIYLNSGDYTRAQVLLNELYSVYGNNPVFAEQLIGIVSFSEDHARVAELGKEMIERFPKSIMIHYFTGFANYMNGNTQEAIRILTRALEIDDKTGDFTSMIYSTLGDLYNDVNNFAESDRYFKMAIALDSNVITLNNYAYYLALREEDLDTALRYSNIAIREEPENASFLDTYAWVLYKLKKYEEAEFYISLAFRNGGNERFEIVKHYAAILIELQRYNEAIDYLKNAAELAGEEEIQHLDMYFRKIEERLQRTY